MCPHTRMLHTDLCYSDMYEPDLDFFLAVYIVVVDGHHLWVFIVLPSPSKSIKSLCLALPPTLKCLFGFFPPLSLPGKDMKASNRVKLLKEHT